VDRSAAEVFGGDRLVGDRLHDIRAGHKHIAGVTDHEDEVGHRRAIDVAARARPHNHGNLRNDTRGQHVPREHLAIPAKRCDTFLDAGTTGIEQADDGRTVAQGEVLDLADFLGMRLGQRPAKDREVLCKQIDDAAVDRAPAGNNAIAWKLRLFHAEVCATVLYEPVEFLERSIIQQQLDPLARRQLAARVLRIDPPLTAAKSCQFATALEFLDDFFHA
jgi:hypothetical protein